MDAFDADVLIYAISRGHPVGRKVDALFRVADQRERFALAGLGSLLLLPEVLSRPRRDGSAEEIRALEALLCRLDLHPLDAPTAVLAVELGAAHRLKAPDAIHLATAVRAGADRFITNNRREFPKSITEVDVTYPDDLADPV